MARISCSDWYLEISLHKYFSGKNAEARIKLFEDSGNVLRLSVSNMYDDDFEEVVEIARILKQVSKELRQQLRHILLKYIKCKEMEEQGQEVRQ